MTLKEAMAIINDTNGFRVTFDITNPDGLLRDSFPSGTPADPLIKDRKQAIDLAKKFAEKAPPDYVNIRIVDFRGVIASGVTYRPFAF